ncbi:MAG: hypothetical protein H7240_13150 [Glaciimonas sp.]|nr:hypothetical protein [Glaciimonas sp.]
MNIVVGSGLWQEVSMMNRQSERLHVQSAQLVNLQRIIDKEKRATQLANKTTQVQAPLESTNSVPKRVKAAWTDEISLLRLQTVSRE